MKVTSISYRQALVGEDKLDEYQKEIARTCALFNWMRTGARPQDTSHPQVWMIENPDRRFNADCRWSLIYVDRDFFQVLSCAFVYNGQPIVEWTPEKGIKLQYPADKIFDVPRARANLQLLVDAVCEKHVGIRQRFLELQRIAQGQ